MNQEVKAEGVRLIPSVAVSGGYVFGVPLPEAVMWMTLIYTCLSVAYVLCKFWRMRKGRE